MGLKTQKKVLFQWTEIDTWKDDFNLPKESDYLLCIIDGKMGRRCEIKKFNRYIFDTLKNTFDHPGGLAINLSWGCFEDDNIIAWAEIPVFIDC